MIVANDVKKVLVAGELFSTFYSQHMSINTTFTLVFFSMPSGISEQWGVYLTNATRDTDIAFKFPASCPYVVLLSNTEERKAKMFVTRIFQGWCKAGNEATFITASILPISSKQSSAKTVIEAGRRALLGESNSSGEYPYVIDNQFS